MKIAIVTDDGQTISAHFGKAAFYAVVTVEDGKVTGREQRAKPAHQHGHQHDHGRQSDQGEMIHLHDEGGAGGSAGVDATHGQMVDPIRDCQVLLARGMGTPAYQNARSAGLQPIITEVREIDEAVRQYLAGTLTDHPERLH